MAEFVDLHTHSTASDGTFSPTQVVQLAMQNGLSALALTDHDTIAGIEEAQKTAAAVGIDFVTGIEISAESPAPGTPHILGYGVDPENPRLREMTTRLLEGRDTRNPKIVARLSELGMALTMDEVESEAGGDVIGRPHIAAVLLKKQYVRSIKEAFDKYLGTGAAAYFDKERLTPRQAIEFIRNSGGVAVLAHPYQLRAGTDVALERVIRDLVDLGLEGLEIYHSDHREDDVRRYRELAEKYKLLQTGGSDFHGGNKPTISLGRAGGYRVARELYDKLVERIEGRK